ncbi:DUF6261 family protein [uncultured Acetobacteroides sp.]|uniref:DUF6261 family protein n=1 Tax=uncultured Acetobacteroides sp. TaxID=1760811 RepID=UPI0029F5BF88|nr:DUF6261 family protein [uncultured Acetobacteroides sp.]
MKTVNLFASPSHALTNVQFSQFVADHLQHLGLIKKEEMTDEEIVKLVATLTALLGSYDKVLVKITKSAISEGVRKLDTNRDISHKALKSALKTESLSTDLEVVGAVHTIETFLNPYGNVPRLSLEAETRAIDAIVAELEGTKYRPMVEKVGITAKVTRLKADNELFKAKYNTRTSEYMAQETADNIELRKQVTEVYTTLCDYAAMMARLERGPLYDKVVTIANTIRTKYAAQDNRSAERKKKDPKKDDKTTKDDKSSDKKDETKK